jgi:hypothetical protein
MAAKIPLVRRITVTDQEAAVESTEGVYDGPVMAGCAGHAQGLARDHVSVSSSTAISLRSKGRYHQRQGVGGVVSSPGTIARPGSGSGTPGIGTGCLAAVTGGAAGGFSRNALVSPAIGRLPAGGRAEAPGPADGQRLTAGSAACCRNGNVTRRVRRPHQAASCSSAGWAAVCS